MANGTKKATLDGQVSTVVLPRRTDSANHGTFHDTCIPVAYSILIVSWLAFAVYVEGEVFSQRRLGVFARQ